MSYFDWLDAEAAREQIRSRNDPDNWKEPEPEPDEPLPDDFEDDDEEDGDEADDSDH